MKNNQVKMGVILSYILIILNTIYGLFITPYVIGCLGEVEYGVYKTIASLTSSLMVLDMGIGSTVMRYVAKYRATDKKEKIPNYVAMNMVQAAILCGIILVAAVGLFQTIRPAYASTFTQSQISRAQQMYILLIGNMVLHVFENVVNGVITGHNDFLFGNGVKILRLVSRMILIVVLLKTFQNALVLVLIDIGITMLFMGIELLYVSKNLNVHIKLSSWEKEVFFDSGKYTFLMFLTSVAAQVNNNLDNVVIGAMEGPQYVTVYSMGLLVFGMFESLSTSVSGVMLPTVTNILEKENAQSEIEELIVQVGRIQFMLMGAALVGFVCIGKDFIAMWLGAGFEDVYLITLLLMVPALFELCVNVCLSILRANNQLGFRTLVLSGSTLLNLVVTYIAVKYWSYIGAAIGTAASFVIGSVVIMNIYYEWKLGLPMLRIYGKIFSRTWICLLIAGGALWMFAQFVHGSALTFVAGIGVFAVIFGGMMIVYGFTLEEKQFLRIGGHKR